jgi:hypothetical protein
MMHCSECDATLNRFDRKCWKCSAVLGSRKSRGPKRFCAVVNIVLSIFMVLTVLSLFTDIGPAFKACLAGLTVIRLVKTSADEMAKLGRLSAFRIVVAYQRKALKKAVTPQWQLALEKSRRA